MKTVYDIMQEKNADFNRAVFMQKHGQLNFTTRLWAHVEKMSMFPLADLTASLC